MVIDLRLISFIQQYGEHIKIVLTLLTSHFPYFVEKLPARHDDQNKFDLLASSMNLLPSLLCTYVGDATVLNINMG